jgi:transposase
MSREGHVRFWERAGVRFPRATRLPLHRQSQILARQGIEIGREVLASWTGTAAAEIVPVVRRLHEMLLASPRLFADETTMPVP